MNAHQLILDFTAEPNQVNKNTRSEIAKKYKEQWRKVVLDYCLSNPGLVMQIYKKSMNTNPEKVGFLFADCSHGDEEKIELDYGDSYFVSRFISNIFAKIDPNNIGYKRITNFLRYLSKVLMIASNVKKDNNILIVSIHSLTNQQQSIVRGFLIPILINSSSIFGGVIPIIEHCKTEKDKEDILFEWLRCNDINASRQYTLPDSQVRIDIMIPGIMGIELKKDKITASDVCQCMEYSSICNIPIVLIGNQIDAGASRGIKGFNSSGSNQKIHYVSWDTAFDYLKGQLLTK